MSVAAQLLDANFRRHISLIPAELIAAKVVEKPGLTWVDSGFDTDTFNVIHIHDGDRMSTDDLEAAQAWFKRKGREYCVWIAEPHRSLSMNRALIQCDLNLKATETGMIRDLETYDVVKSDDLTSVKSAVTQEAVEEFGRIVAANWNPPSTAVTDYFVKAAPEYVKKKDDVRLFKFIQGGQAVGTLEYVPTDSHTVGLYSITTRADFRGQGIGTTLVRFALNQAKTDGFKQVVLQATEAGQSIYRDLGFKAVTTYYEMAL